MSVTDINTGTGLTGGPITTSGTISAVQYVFNVMAYGATGNGVTDDTTSIQNAINAACAANGCVYFPAGTYLISVQLLLTSTFIGHIAFRGDGRTVSLIMQTTANEPGLSCLFTYGDFPAGNTVEISDLGFIANCPPPLSPTNAGSFVIGLQYTIASTGTTNFESIGAANNNPGTVFIATGVGSGSGTATPSGLPCNAAIAISYTNYPVTPESTPGSKISRVWIGGLYNSSGAPTNYNAGWAVGIFLNLTTHIVVEDVVCVGNKNGYNYGTPGDSPFNIGIDITFGVNMQFINCSCKYFSQGVRINYEKASQDPQGVWFSGLTIFGCVEGVHWSGTDPEPVTAGDFDVGTLYMILEVGTTDFTLIGASSNTVGVFFTATGAGSGSGVAEQVAVAGPLFLDNFSIDSTPSQGDTAGIILDNVTYTSLQEPGSYIANGVIKASGSPSAGVVQLNNSSNVNIFNCCIIGLSTASMGVYITNGAVDNMISQCAFFGFSGSSQNAIFIDSDCTGNLIRDNQPCFGGLNYTDDAAVNPIFGPFAGRQTAVAINAAQSVPSGSEEYISWDQANYDDLGAWNNSSPTLLSLPAGVGGASTAARRVRVNVTIRWNTMSTGNITVKIKDNFGNVWASDQRSATSDAAPECTAFTPVIDVQSTSITSFAITVIQDSGAAISLESNSSGHGATGASLEVLR